MASKFFCDSCGRDVTGHLTETYDLEIKTPGHRAATVEREEGER